MPKLITVIAAMLVFAGDTYGQTELSGRIEHVDPQARIVVIDGAEYTVSTGAPIRGTPSEPGRPEDLDVGMDVVVTVLEATPGSRRGLITSVKVQPR